MLSLVLLIAIKSAAAEAPRIVSLHPAITENLFALGLGKNVVGTTEFSDFPPEAKIISRIGDHLFSQEKIISLKPTHIVTISDRIGISKSLVKKANIKIVRVKFEELADFIPALETLGKEFQVEEQAKVLEKQWTDSWISVVPQSRGQSAVIQVQTDPIVVVGQNTFLDSILSKCGLKNAIEISGYPTLNRETLAKLDPERIVLLLTDVDESVKQLAKKSWRHTSKSHPVVFFDPNTISKLTPRLPHETQKFCKVLR